MGNSVGIPADAIRRNFILNVLDGAFFAFGMSFVSRATVLPVLIKRIGGGNIAIGIIPVLWFVGFNLPQLLIASRAERAPRKKTLLLVTALGQRLPWLLLAFLVYYALEHVSTTVGLSLVLGAFVMAALGGSINMPVWFDLVSKVTPVRLRGRLFALRTILGAMLGIVGGWIVEVVLSGMTYPDNFAVLIALSFAAMMVSYIFLVLLYEEADVVDDGSAGFEGLFRRLPAILKEESNFRHFLVGQVLIVAATLAEVFFAVDAIGRFSLSEAYAGRFVIVMMATLMIGSLLFGYLADHLGHRLNLIIAAVSMGVACLVAVTAPTVTVYYLAFAGVALALGLQNISRLTIVAEMCKARDRPTYVAITNLVTTPFLFLGVLAGWGADRHGYDSVFIIAGIVAATAALWLAIMVREPREDKVKTVPVR